MVSWSVKMKNIPLLLHWYLNTDTCSLLPTDLKKTESCRKPSTLLLLLLYATTTTTFFHQRAGTVAQDVPNGLGMGGLSLLVDDNGGNVNNPQLNGPQNILVRYQFQYQSN